MSLLTFTTDNGKMLLSCRRAFKTDGFIHAARRVAAIDGFLSRVAEGLFHAGFTPSRGRYYKVTTEDGSYTLSFTGAFGAGMTGEEDLIFYDYSSVYADEGGCDHRLQDYMRLNRLTSFSVGETEAGIGAGDTEHLYTVSEGSEVNFPLLNKTQREIVETEDANMLVQGVAGSGKTNVCVGKLVYCACRGYRGRVLYTTFSRGLLMETKEKVRLFERSIEDFIEKYDRGDVVFLDADKQRAVELKLGIRFRTGEVAGIVEELRGILEFLRGRVDYFLIEDVYSDLIGGGRVASEEYFTEEFLAAQRNKLSGILDKIKNIQTEIVYKEIYGMIFGKYDPARPGDMMTKEEYVAAREDSFTRQECEAIHYVAQEYAQFLKRNGYADNNSMSRELIALVDSPLYSVAVVDEVQDFTQVNLFLLKRLTSKLFCVGDAMQMINPSYFNFAFVKRLMYGDITGITELRHNYRSTDRIERIAEGLSELNVKKFGTHSFVLRGESVTSPLDSSAVYIKGDFSKNLTDERYENVTVIVASEGKKRELRKTLKKPEILTVAEAKGLERNTVILVDVLSDNFDRWARFEKTSVNRKSADENSVYRYYFNLFYVGISRARQHLFVSERNCPPLFDGLFEQAFDETESADALRLLGGIAGRIEIDDEELIRRIGEFCKLSQYDNARFAADRLSSDALRKEYAVRIGVYKDYTGKGDYRGAGLEYWRNGMDEAAREMFTKSGDEALFPLMDACKSGGGSLDVGIVRYLPLALDNEVAKKLIFETISRDRGELVARQREINDMFKSKRKRK